MIVNTELANSSGCEQKDKWETPPHIYNKLNDEFHFTLDPCCEPETAKCCKFYTEDDNGLTRSWKGETVFVNPPYSRGNIDKWVKKCLHESRSATVVALLPVSSSSDWFHKYIIGNAEIRFVNKRIRFIGAHFTAPFSSVVVVFGGSGIQSFNQ
jgi:site-specific DNA-methyltransferase (adenine-specific)